jgi:hypothetical protein
MKRYYLIGLLFSLVSIGFLWAEPPGEKRYLVLPLVANSRYHLSETYSTHIKETAASGPRYIFYHGYGSGTGGRINTTCPPSPAVSYEKHIDGWLGSNTIEICSTRNSTTDYEFGWILITEFIPEGFESNIQYSTIIFQRSGNPKELKSIISVPAVVPRKRFLVRSYYVHGYEGYPITSYSIVNPSKEETAVIKLHAGGDIHQDTYPECKTEISLPPLQQLRKFITELVPGCTHVDSTLLVESDIPIAVAAMEVYLPEYRFVSLPVIELDDNE